MANVETKSDCLFAPIAFKYITSKIFILQAQYDLWQIDYILHMQCIQGWDTPYMLPCTDSEMEQINEFKDYSKNLLIKANSDPAT